MSTLRYFAMYENGGVTSITVSVEGVQDPIGYTQIDYATFEQYQNDIGNLDILQSACEKQIDAVAGDVRRQFITVVPGQESTYLMKGQEARDIKASNYTADILGYPLIAAEMAAQPGSTLQQVVDVILATENLWRQLAAVIEKERRMGKIAVKNATTTMDCLTAKQSAISALESIRYSY